MLTARSGCEGCWSGDVATERDGVLFRRRAEQAPIDVLVLVLAAPQCEFSDGFVSLWQEDERPMLLGFMN